jgi:Asp-tRNA(Asn)/Glu-tRNA(Gln) amidotransferase A subunit family amidase
MSPAELAYASIGELAPAIHRGDISPVELTEIALERIARLNPVLNAFITIDAEGARAAAKWSEA